MKKEEKILREYKLQAIAPFYDGKNQSILYTYQDEHVLSEKKVEQILDQYCLVNGASLEGRKQASRKRFKDVKNPSILISELNAIAAFQVPSLDGLDPIWIVDLDVEIKSLRISETEIIFRNNLKLKTYLPANLVEKRKAKALRILHEVAYHYFRKKNHH